MAGVGGRGGAATAREGPAEVEEEGRLAAGEETMGTSEAAVRVAVEEENLEGRLSEGEGATTRIGEVAVRLAAEEEEARLAEEEVARRVEEGEAR